MFPCGQLGEVVKAYWSGVEYVRAVGGGVGIGYRERLSGALGCHVTSEGNDFTAELFEESSCPAVGCVDDMWGCDNTAGGGECVVGVGMCRR
jgi:hypothetical protein